ncbi:MAG: tandem-95 repeat protein [bacterium]
MKTTLSISIMVGTIGAFILSSRAQEIWLQATLQQHLQSRQLAAWPQIMKPMNAGERSWLIPGDENWGDQFAAPGTDYEVNAIAVLGDTVYVGGAFTQAGGMPANHIAKWDGKRWSALGSGVNGTVLSIAVSGNDIYVGGAFTKAGQVTAKNLAKWNGATWSVVDNGLNGAVRTIAVKDSILYVGGDFMQAGNLTVNRIAKWDGKQWSSLGSGVSGINEAVNVITVDGSAIYAGGVFETIGGVYVNHIAKWTGSRWQALGSGVFIYGHPIGPLYGGVHAIAVRGSDVYVGGNISGAGVSSATGIARWDGSDWYKLGAGISGPVWTIAIEGNNLYAGTILGGNVAKWNGASWSGLRSGISGAPQHVFALAVHNSNLYAGGDYAKAGAFIANKVARWDGQAWWAMGNEIIGLDNYVNAMARNDSGVCVAGGFITADRLVVNRVTKWDGQKWSTLGSGMNEEATSLAISGNEIYVGGGFTEAGGVPANRIAKWDGTSWSALGSGVNNYVYALATNGEEVYAGGEFTEAGGAPASQIAKWDGSSWSALGNGVNGRVQVITVHGSDIYVGGSFTEAGEQSANNIAKWDGLGWSALGAGVNSEVAAIIVRDNEVFVGGYFTQAGGMSAKYIAKWDGSQWWDLDSRMDGAVKALAVNAGILYVGGQFTEAGGVVADQIAKWHGTRWSSLGSGLSGFSWALAVDDHNLFVGGSFGKTGNKGAWNFAKWHEPNLAPLARSDRVVTDEEQAVAFNVLLNDADVDGQIDTNSVRLVQMPAHGAVQSQSGGVMTYIPNLDFSGDDRFVYVVNDLQGVPSNQAAVRIRVNNINDAPVLDNRGIMFLTTIVMGDTSSPGDMVADIIASAGDDRITDVDSGAVEGIAVIDVDDTNGTWQYSLNGGVSWTGFGAVSDTAAVLLNPAMRIRFKPKVDFSGSAGEIIFRAWDQTSGANGDRNVNASINGGATAFSRNIEAATLKVNIRPLAQNDTLVTDEDRALVIEVTQNDLDSDGNIIKSTVSITQKPVHGVLMNNVDSTFTYTPNPNFNGRDSLRYTVKDNDGAVSNEAGVLIIVKAVNDAPAAFRRLRPADNSMVRAQQVIFMWTRARDVDGDTVSYTLNLTAGRLDTSFVTTDTTRIIDFPQLNLESDSLQVTWTVTATDGRIKIDPLNRAGTFILNLVTGVNDQYTEKLPAAFILHENYPNPLRLSANNSGTFLRYELPQAAFVRLEIFDVLGRTVQILIDEKQSPGLHQRHWDGLDHTGVRVHSGIYFYRFYAQTQDAKIFAEVKKMLLIH